MKNFAGFTKNILLASVLALAFQAGAYAAYTFNGAILKAIKVDRSADRDYVITIKTDKDLPIKKYAASNDQLVLDLKNARPAQFVNTLYSNSAAVKNIIIQPLSGDRIKIFLHGANITSGKVILDTRNERFSPLPAVQPVIAKPAPKTAATAPAAPAKITVPQSKQAKPAQAAETPKATPEQPKFQPIYIDLSKDFHAQNAASSAGSAVEKVRSVTPIISYEDRYNESYSQPETGFALSNLLSASPLDWVLRLGMLAVIIVGAIRLFAGPKNVEISLASANTKLQDKNIYKSAEAHKEILTKSLGLPTKRDRTAKISSLSSYGLKEYQNSQLPPRGMSQPLPARKPAEKSNIGALRPNVMAKAGAAANTAAKSQVQPANSRKISRKQTQEAKDNFDGVKFLETMASIYQKSGRGDLATGIRQNLIKKQQAA